MSTEPSADSGLDIEKGAQSIASDLWSSASPPEDSDNTPDEGAKEPQEANDDGPKQSDGEKAQADAPQQAALRPPPKSWAKEKHELWTKLPPDAQEYYELREKQFLDGIEQYKSDASFAKQIRDILTPYVPILKAQGISETDAIQYLLNAHYRLTQGSDAERRAAYEQLGRDLGFVQQQAAEGQVADPRIDQLQNEIQQLKSARQAEMARTLQAARQEADKAVQAFAADPAHPYFDEVASDMVPFINAGDDLKTAYDKAVWANPVTRQKEIARLQTEQAQKSREQAKATAEAARRTASTNVRGVETNRAPTEPKGTMEDTLRETYRKITQRT